jgi:predicted SAM-dependent methyltransferase
MTSQPRTSQPVALNEATPSGGSRGTAIHRSLAKMRPLAKRVAAGVLYRPYLVRFRMRRGMESRLHVGCGRNRFPGWINAEISPRAELIIFLEKPLPFRSGTLDRIYSEHVLEHLEWNTTVHFLSEAHRTLRVGGVIRTAMPDLGALVESYQNDWRQQDWLSWPQYRFIKTRAQMMNIAFRWWGHRHLYDEEELGRALREAGFHENEIRRCGHGVSDHADLCGLETRTDSKLIVEATRT